MTSFIVRDAMTSYTPPGAVMYLTSGGALPRVAGEESGSEEEDEDYVRQQQQRRQVKDTRATSHGVSGDTRRRGTAARSGTEKRSADSAYSTATMTTRDDNDERGSTTSSQVPVDPSTQVPVFLSTSDLEFIVAGDVPDERKVLTLYNPYEYTFDYRIYCTAPEHYEIRTPGSTVRAKHLVDITIRGKSSLMPNMVHKLRVDIMRSNRNEIIGSRTVTTRAIAYTAQRPYPDQGVFHRMGGEDRMRRDMMRGAANVPEVRIEPAQANPLNISVILCLGLLCALALVLPVQKDMTPTSSIIPHYLHISETQRLCAAFLLGVFSVLLLQPAHNR